MQKSAVEDPNSRNAAIGLTRGRGRAVIARRKISKGEVIERAPVIVIPKKEWTIAKKTILDNYAFDWGENDEHAVIALGYVSIYNHSYSPNAKLEQMPADMMMEVTALRTIQPGEEVTINYNGDPRSRARLWFDVVSSKKRSRRQ